MATAPSSEITYQYDILRKMTVLFGSLFNEIYINRSDANGNNIGTMKVPLAYAPRDKMLARKELDPKIDRPTAISLPDMSFQIINISYDPERKQNTMNPYYYPMSDGNVTSMYEPVPYNIHFQLYVYAKNTNDGNMVVEQLLPLFTPAYTRTVSFFDNIQVEREIPIILNSTELMDTYDQGNFDNRRAIIWTLDFTMKTYLFGPQRTSNLIKFVELDFYIPVTNTAADGIGVTDIAESLTIKPGLTANGQPTSNSADSISYLNINATDNYGFIVDYISNNA